MATSILIIEDDARLARMVQEYLDDNGFKATVADTGAKGLSQIKTRNFDALILDLMLPDIDGFEVFRSIPETHALPVIMLTAKGDPLDRIIGLELGADDYLPKPFEPRELLARLKSIMRRGASTAAHEILEFGRLAIDRDAMEARIAGCRCDITNYQFQILVALAESAGRVMTRDHLMNQLQGHDADAFDRSIDVHVSRIRAAIEDDPKKPKRLVTVRGTGYLFARTQD
ncbi:MAG: response regulator transcription factor [Pseudomonadota bacterium]